ncbi:MAG: sensor histidine kinase [Desulfobacteraceae bacterium]|nr:MAG: sensor histidine kinase [Desulfobacteraceae bacterium]
MALSSISPGSSQAKDFPYFRRIWKTVITALLAVSLVPLIVIGGGMYYYASTILEEQALERLRNEVVNHKEVLDRFLRERTTDLRLLAGNIPLDVLTQPGALEKVFSSLQQQLSCFTDLGIIDDQGRHLAYVGPFELITRNYKTAEWFQAIRDRDFHISDVFLGFRNVPHFVIAVRQPLASGFWILRATVDTAFFDKVVTGIRRGEKGDAFLVNRKGIFQTTPYRSGRLMGSSEFDGTGSFQGVLEREKDGTLQTMVWLDQAPWMCVVQMDRSEIFKELHRMRNIAAFVFMLGGILILMTVLLTTNYLIGRLEVKRKNIRYLDHQLQHSSRMAHALKFSPGFFIKLKNDLGKIDMLCRSTEECIREKPGQESAGSPEPPKEIAEALCRIRSKIFNARKSIDRFLNAIRPVEPMILEVDVNELLEGLSELFDPELRFSRIRLKRDYQEPAPRLRSDPARLRQIFQNLIFNAANAVRRDGEIVLKSRAVGDRVQITITDTGAGIPEENRNKIFDPHFTSKPEGMELGLSICRNIVRKLGGTLAVMSGPERGSAFVVELPMRFTGYKE